MEEKGSCIDGMEWVQHQRKECSIEGKSPALNEQSSKEWVQHWMNKHQTNKSSIKQTNKFSIEQTNESCIAALNKCSIGKRNKFSIEWMSEQMSPVSNGWVKEWVQHWKSGMNKSSFVGMLEQTSWALNESRVQLWTSWVLNESRV